MKENIFKVLFAAVTASLTAYFGKIAIPLFVLLVVMIADYVTGMAKAWITRNLNSRIGLVGILKKIAYLFAICVGIVVDWVLGVTLSEIGISYNVTFSFGILVVIWLIINELISILENLGSIGVPLPDFLVKIVSKLKTTVDSKTSIETIDDDNAKD